MNISPTSGKIIFFSSNEQMTKKSILKVYFLFAAAPTLYHGSQK